MLPVDPSWLERRRVGAVVRLLDARGSRRELRIVEVGRRSCEAEIWDTTYIETGAELSCGGDVTRVGDLPRIPEYHLLCVGDVLVLTRGLDHADAMASWATRTRRGSGARSQPPSTPPKSASG